MARWDRTLTIRACERWGRSAFSASSVSATKSPYTRLTRAFPSGSSSFVRVPWPYGSQYQLRRWVLEDPNGVNRDLLERNGELRAWARRIEWLSPNADTHVELRDDAWGLIGLTADSPQKAGWWPSGGAVWDGVARVDGPEGEVGGIFVEAKGRPGELTGGGMKATSDKSIARIKSALADVQAFLGVAPSDEWLRACYQPANRLALLWYARNKCEPPAPVWLVSMYFLGEHYPKVTSTEVGPETEEAWKPIIEAVHQRMGLPPHPHALSSWWIESFLPALEPPSGRTRTRA